VGFTHNSSLSKNEPDWGTVDKTKLPRKAFADQGDAAKVSTWSYPHHWVSNGGSPDKDGRFTTGTMYLHRGGLNAAWSAAQGGRSGEKASAEVIAHLESHRKALKLDTRQSHDLDREEIPLAALRFKAGLFTFGEQTSGGESDAHLIPVHLLARSSGPVDSPWFGRVYHDFAGMSIHKDRLPLDYVHDPTEILGYLDHFASDAEGLKADGAMVSVHAQDRASEIHAKQLAGVPYEASIAFAGPLALEELDDGVSAEANGQTVTGPATIVRRWSLRGVAVCPYGMDPNTSTEFAEGAETVSLRVTRIQIQGASPMPEEKKTDAAGDRTELQRFMSAFGDAAGAKHYAAGLTFEQAVAEQYQEVAREAKQLREQNADLAKALEATKHPLEEAAVKIGELTAENARIAKELSRMKIAYPRGLEGALSGNPAPEPLEEGETPEDKERTEQFKETLGPNIGAFAAGIKLPGRNRLANRT
jgi:hypothetical protein